LITEGGHIKLTDFGGCRPISEAAHEALTASKSQLGSIRDGDWKTNEEGEGGKKSSAAKMEDGGAGSTSEEDEAAWIASLSNEDGRVEGTVAYCAPEIVKGESLPCFLSDVWALGCVAYFVLRGRLPFFHDTVEGLKHSIVNFVGEEYSANNDAPSSVGRYLYASLSFFSLSSLIFLTRDIFICIHLNTQTCKTPTPQTPYFLYQATISGLDYPSESFSDIAREFISKLLQPDPNLRLSLASAAQHTFFTDFGVDVYALHFHEPYLLHTGSAAPPPQDAKWARRQHSHIWAPELEVYDFTQGKDKKCSNLGYYKTGTFSDPDGIDEVDFLEAPRKREKKKSKSELPPLAAPGSARLGGIGEDEGDD
jgi:serine/threonine protein kinase